MSNVEAWFALSQHEELATGSEHLRELVNEQALYLCKIERKIIERKFDATQPFLSLLLSAPIAWGGYLAWQQDGWGWRAITVFAGLLIALLLYTGVVGFFKPARVESDGAEG